MDTFALYVHIPFCARKCRYCAFASSELESPDRAAEVLSALLVEADHYARRAPWREREVHSLFIGGGTPSTLRGRQIGWLLNGLRERFPLTGDAEVTIEANPGTLSGEKLEGWRRAGIRRVSLGVQSLEGEVLRVLGRIHSADQARQAFQRLREAGFDNLNVDLMYGVAASDALGGWKRTLDEVMDWGPEHLSAYALIVEPGTPLSVEEKSGKRVKPPEELELAQYDYTRDRLAAAGYEHYEVSNWARPGHRSRHNVSYWDGGSYLALGPAGHAYDATRHRRFWHDPDTARWLGGVRREGHGEAGEERLTPRQVFEERLMLSLRMVDGAEEEVLAKLARRADIPWPPEALGVLERQGMLERREGVLRYTRQGLLIADELEALLTREG